MTDAYTQAGVDVAGTDEAVKALVAVLEGTRLSGGSRSRIASGHYAAVIEAAPNLGIAITTDGVGSKLILAQQLGRFDSIGIDCVAMNVNDLICIGAKPLALVDYIAVQEANSAQLAAIAAGLRRGAELADVEIPGGEVAVLPELIRGHPSPTGFDLAATCIGTVALDRIVTGSACEAGDALIALPSSGLHSNGYSLARQALLKDAGFALADSPSALGGDTVGEALLKPTTIYVRAICELLASGIAVNGLAHITGGGLRNLTRLHSSAGFEIEEPLVIPPIFDLIASSANIGATEMWEVFNMGTGFFVVVPETQAEQAISLLASHHESARRVGTVAGPSSTVSVTSLGLQFS